MKEIEAHGEKGERARESGESDSCKQTNCREGERASPHDMDRWIYGKINKYRYIEKYYTFISQKYSLRDHPRPAKPGTHDPAGTLVAGANQPQKTLGPGSQTMHTIITTDITMASVTTFLFVFCFPMRLPTTSLAAYTPSNLTLPNADPGMQGRAKSDA